MAEIRAKKCEQGRGQEGSTGCLLEIPIDDRCLRLESAEGSCTAFAAASALNALGYTAAGSATATTVSGLGAIRCFPSTHSPIEPGTLTHTTISVRRVSDTS